MIFKEIRKGGGGGGGNVNFILNFFEILYIFIRKIWYMVICLLVFLLSKRKFYYYIWIGINF